MRSRKITQAFVILVFGGIFTENIMNNNDHSLDILKCCLIYFICSFFGTSVAWHVLLIYFLFYCTAASDCKSVNTDHLLQSSCQVAEGILLDNGLQQISKSMLWYLIPICQQHICILSPVRPFRIRLFPALPTNVWIEIWGLWKPSLCLLCS